MNIFFLRKYAQGSLFTNQSLKIINLGEYSENEKNSYNCRMRLWRDLFTPFKFIIWRNGYNESLFPRYCWVFAIEDCHNQKYMSLM